MLKGDLTCLKYIFITIKYFNTHRHRHTPSALEVNSQKHLHIPFILLVTSQIVLITLNSGKSESEVSVGVGEQGVWTSERKRLVNFPFPQIHPLGKSKQV